MKQYLKKKTSESCFESDRLMISPLQVIINSLNAGEKFSNFHRQRNESAIYFKKKLLCQISYSQVLQELKHTVTKSSVNNKAKKSFLMRHDNLLVIIGEHGVGKSAIINTLMKDMQRFSLNNPVIVFFIQLQDVDFTEKIDLLQFLAPFLKSESFWWDKNRKIILKEIKKAIKFLS